MQSQQIGQSQQASNDREREMRDERHAEEMALQAEQRERELRERSQIDQAPHENHAGSIHLHQPVAVGPQLRGVHGPNGLLGNSSQMGPSTMAAQPPASIFASGPGQQQNEGARIQQQHPVQGPQQQQQQQQQGLMVPFGGPQGMQQSLAMGQGQQPILNDALSYLDQVKVQFHEHPDVYNKFLDIMKDFKSGAIDTPGVIDRVSSLFAGHPNLIQGFNTFLPPGYKIECGTGGDPNAIRVTTPMGTTVQSMPVPRPLSNPRNVPVNGDGAGAPERQFYEATSRGPGANWPQQQQQQQQQQPGTGPEAAFSPSRPVVQPHYTSQQGQGSQAPISPEAHAREQMTAAALAHQQEQRGVSQLSNAVSAATGGLLNRPDLISPPGGAAGQMPAQSLNGVGHLAQQAGAQAVLDKRGPVEFNHAISYVNKIKNRFATQPDIYKQFLEILQTYQRESKPIQDVYAQVTQLFNSAPDLLEDFKQFLPESAAQHRAAQARQAAEEQYIFSNVRGEPAGTPQMHHTPRNEQGSGRLPPVGNFAPTPSASRDNKRKRGERQGTVASSTAMPASMPAEAPGVGQRPGFAQGGNMAKRAKQQHGAKQSALPDVPPASPTLTPALPEPLAPTTSLAASAEELAWFDRVKKYIGNKNTMNEFLKLCNLFSMDLIDKSLLLHRVHAFIGGNPELMGWFRKFLGFDGKEDTLENQPKPPSGRVALSNCRGLGPSYRQLPRAEKMRRCSGRDELCHSVLNDEWASHPTWASEDSGFVAHRKNQYEEGLHRIEEERHDYDHTIEACIRTIQQLEPIAQQLLNATAEERLQFQLPSNLGGQSETIYKRVIYKIYNRERGNQVIQQLFDTPYQVIPVLLNRMKQKLEEWKAAQREWEKVWREQTQRIFWKSLDHQSASAKAADKRQFQAKTLQNEIQVKYEEQKRQREMQGLSVPKYQFEYKFTDVDVLLDASRLLLAHAEHSNSTDSHRLYTFIKEFVPLFFGLNAAKFEQSIGSPQADSTDDEMGGMDDSSRKSLKINGKKDDLRRGVLDPSRSGRTSRKDADESNASGSRGSTPEATSAADEEMAEDADVTASVPKDTTSDRWLEHPTGGNNLDISDIAPDGPYKRDVYNMYCNLPIYCFFRMFVILYERLSNLKQNEDHVHELVERAKHAKPALDLNLIDKRPEEFFRDTSAHANFYQQVLEMFMEQIRGEVEMPQIEETLRRYYLQTGWQLYSFDKLLSSLVRFAFALLSSDAKDKTWDIYQLFRKDRQQEETTHDAELNYRRTVEKYSKDGDVYKISYDQLRSIARVMIFKREEPTFDTKQTSQEQNWRAYLSSFTRITATEGVPAEKVKIPFLRRDAPTDDDEQAEASQDVKSEETLTIRIALERFTMVFEPNTSEYLLKSDKVRSGGNDGIAAAEQERENRASLAKEKLVMNNAWMKDLSKDVVDGRKQKFSRMVAEGADALASAAAPAEATSAAPKEGKAAAATDGDTEMEGA
ncbi:Paired amphipathic helix [Macrophomina phaseolina MS6]|uniref:Paired amphipathic helix n=1 Tax=Macrophomina phaseolina (strain MS6) TaxID=1126212 RepID=K2SAY4_MACPH|nr:Paired amphipathic helix [Macrophomina phaseolina MS6]